MKHPLDASDIASLIQADWHEEYGDISVAEEIRESVLEPPTNDWSWPTRSLGVGDKIALSCPATPTYISYVGGVGMQVGCMTQSVGCLTNNNGVGDEEIDEYG